MDKIKFSQLFNQDALNTLRALLVEYCGEGGSRRITAENVVTQYFDLSEIDLESERARRGVTKGGVRTDDDLLKYRLDGWAQTVQAVALSGLLDDSENNVRFTQHYGARGGLGLVDESRVATSDLASKLEKALEELVKPGVFVPTRTVAMACLDKGLNQEQTIEAHNQMMSEIPDLMKMKPFSEKYGMLKGPQGGIGLLSSIQEVEAKKKEKDSKKSKNSSSNAVPLPEESVASESEAVAA